MTIHKIDNYKLAFYSRDYVPVAIRDASDVASSALLDFKNGKTESIDQWTKVATKDMKAFLDHTQITLNYIVKVLGSNELLFNANEKRPIDQLILSLCNTYSIQYAANVLCKKHTNTKLSSVGSSRLRKIELQDIYDIYPIFEFNHNNVLVVDDVYTTGASVQSVAQVLTNWYPDVRLYCYTLTRTIKH